MSSANIIEIPLAISFLICPFIYFNIFGSNTLFFQGIGIMVSPNDPFWQYDFDDAYFNSDDDNMDNGGCGDDMDTSSSDDDMDINDCDDDMTTGASTDSEYDSEEEEFWFVFPLIGRWWHISNGITTSAHNVLAF